MKQLFRHNAKIIYNCICCTEIHSNEHANQTPINTTTLVTPHYTTCGAVYKVLTVLTEITMLCDYILDSSRKKAVQRYVVIYR